MPHEIIDVEFEPVGPAGQRRRWFKPYRALPRLIAFAPCLIAVWACAAIALNTEDRTFRAALVVIAAFQWPIHRASDWFWRSLHERVPQQVADDLRERIIGRRGEL